MTIDDKGLAERFLNPDDALLAAYWRYSPRPIEIDQENADAARKHLANLVRAASDAVLSARPSPALPADDKRLVADLEHMWHFPVPPDDKSARMYSETAKRAAEALSRREWQPIETAPKDGTEILLFGPYPENNDGFSTRRVTAGFWCEPPPPVIGDCGGECRCPEYGVPDEPFWCSMHGGSSSGWMSTDGGFTAEWPPTHWMPLPTPPAASQPAGGEGE